MINPELDVTPVQLITIKLQPIIHVFIFKTSFQLSRTSTKPHQGVPLVLSQLSRTLAEVDRWMDTIVLL